MLAYAYRSFCLSNQGLCGFVTLASIQLALRRFARADVVASANQRFTMTNVGKSERSFPP